MTPGIPEPTRPTAEVLRDIAAHLNDWEGMGMAQPVYDAADELEVLRRRLADTEERLEEWRDLAKRMNWHAA